MRWIILLLMITVTCHAGETGYEITQEDEENFNQKMCFQLRDRWVIKGRDGITSCKSAAIDGNVYAQVSLGIVNSIDNKELSFYWYKKAAEQGLRSAQIFLGYSYLNGDGVEKDPVRGLMWLEIATDVSDLASSKWVTQENQGKMKYFLGQLSKEKQKKAKSMSRDQVANALKMSKACKANNLQEC